MLANHEVATAYERGWSTLKNGDLLASAEAEGFDVLVTTAPIFDISRISFSDE
jgi:hypothetical protein